jgi:hypothetical protein
VNNQSKQLITTRKRSLRGATLAVVMVVGVAGQMQTQSVPVTVEEQSQTITRPDKFQCNRNALNPTERTHHKVLTDKLIANRTEIVGTAIGYEFQFSPATVSLADLADWVAVEGKCCQFFDFHIDLERRGGLLCLRLTGAEGVKPFIRSEFRVSAK